MVDKTAESMVELRAAQRAATKVVGTAVKMVEMMVEMMAAMKVDGTVGSWVA